MSAWPPGDRPSWPAWPRAGEGLTALKGRARTDRRARSGNRGERDESVGPRALWKGEFRLRPARSTPSDRGLSCFAPEKGPPTGDRRSNATFPVGDGNKMFH